MDISNNTIVTNHDAKTASSATISLGGFADDDLITKPELCKCLNCSERTLQRMVDRFEIPPGVELGRLPDSEIDYSDIPASTDDDLALYKPVKKLTTIRIDADVLAWLKTYGKGYQTKINAILRQEMLAAKGK